MKQKHLLPYTTKQYNQLKELHQEAVARYKENPIQLFNEQVHELTEKIFEYENVVLYNKYAVNRCKFSNSDDTEEICERNFNNTFRHFTIHGNCCQSCSNYFNACIKPKKTDVTVDEMIQHELDIIHEKISEFNKTISEEKQSEGFKKKLSTV